MAEKQAMKILIVEDDTPSRMILQSHLESWDYMVLTAEDGIKALDTISVYQPEIVLIGWETAKNDGAELCRKIRSMDSKKYTYIIFMTEQAENREIVNLLDSGADDYLSKPFDKNIIRSRIRVGHKVIYYEDEMRKSQQKSADSQKKLDEVNLQLELTYKKLMETAHRAGMAEVASNVLHNVGNILNSINVSAELAYEKVSRSEIENLQKIVELINSHSHDLANFLTSDPKGRHIPAYLTEAVSHTAKMKAEMLKNLSSLIKNVNNIKQVINSQRLYTNDSNTKDVVELPDLIENAIEINNAGLQYWKIEVIREYGDCGKIVTDKQRVLQILVSLIDNAQQAMAESTNSPKLLKIRTSKIDDKVRIEITDNGTGIMPEDLNKIFSCGFTTKPTGHGFGLHSCKMAATDMRGTISVSSDGRNKGATFTLELPANYNEVQNAESK